MTDHRTKEERIVRTAAGGWRHTDGAYHEWWLARVMKKVIKDDSGCWLWQGSRHPKGYGQTAYRGKSINLHRAMWMVVHEVRLIEEQLVCHKCDVRHCCNPDHLFLGDAKANNNDCAGKGRHHNTVKTHCKRGHPYTEENTGYKALGTGSVARVCKTCEELRMKSDSYVAWRRGYQRRRRAEKRAKRLAQENCA